MTRLNNNIATLPAQDWRVKFAMSTDILNGTSFTIDIRDKYKRKMRPRKRLRRQTVHDAIPESMKEKHLTY